MLKDIVEVRHAGGTRLAIRFEDGVTGEIDLSEIVSFVGIFEPLKDPAFFARVAVLPDVGTIGWPNGADLDPCVLYSKITGRSLPDSIRKETA